MAFCPNCGKPVTEQASTCLACGQDFEPRGKGARFKGTMMMTPASAPQAPAAPAPAQPAKAAAPAAAPAPSAAAAPAPRPMAPGPSKVAKATMLGTGGAGISPLFAPPATAAAVPQAPPAAGGGQPPTPAAPPTSDAIAPTDPAPAPASVPAAPPREVRAAADVRAAKGSAEREDSQRLLLGDPMAPAQPAPRVRRLTPQPSDSAAKGQRAGLLVAIGLAGMLLIAAVGYFTARFLGLIQ